MGGAVSRCCTFIYLLRYCMGKITLQKDIKIIPFIAGLVLWIGYLYFNHRVNTFSNSVVRKWIKNKRNIILSEQSQNPTDKS